MARPQKEGLDYYPKNVDMLEDRKIRRLMKEFGCKGYVVYDYLLCVIYRDKGYYVRYDDGLAFDIADFIQDGVSENLVKQIITGGIRHGLFDKGLYDKFSVLTSSGIQKRYKNIKPRGVIDSKLVVMIEETTETDPITPKVKESKEQEIKLKESKIKKIPPELEFLDYCKENLGEGYINIEFSLKAKYKSWVENDWKDGYNNEIKNWKSKILNVIPHLGFKNQKNTSQKEKTKTEVLLSTAEIVKQNFANEQPDSTK